LVTISYQVSKRYLGGYGERMSTPILVTGASGKTGRRLVPLLSARGATVRAASRTSTDWRFDWHSPETHDRALSGAAALYLIPPDLIEDPVPVVAPLLDRARQAGVQRVVLLSSLGVTFAGEPASSGRRRLEEAVRGSGLAWTILRPSGFMQNFSEGFLAPGVLRGAIATATEGAVAYVDAGDIAAVAAATLIDDGHAGATYALTGPEALMNAQAAALISEAVRRPVVHRAIGTAAMTDLLRGFGIPDDYVAMLVRDMEAIGAGAGAGVSADIERVTGRGAVTFAQFAAAAFR
jgi:uncharacterized protein YbjT (DUF2867 family)